MYIITSICNIPAVLKIMKFILTLLNIIRFIIPMILIVMVMIDIAKNVIAGTEDIMKKNINIAIRRVLIGIAIFLVPTFVSASINLLGSTGNKVLKTYSKCEKNINNIEEVEKKYEDKQKKEIEKYEKKLEKKNKKILKNKEVKYEAFNISDVSNNNDFTNDSINNEGQNTGAGEWKYYNQADGWGNNCTSKTMKGSGCGLTSFAVVANALSGKKVTPANVRDYMCNHGHGGGAMGESWFTNSGLLNNFNVDSRRLFYNGYGKRTYNKEQGKLIKGAIDSGLGVVLLIPGHYVAIGPGKDCGNNQVYLYNVGRRSDNGCYTMKGLWNRTWNYKNRCYNGTNKCGWKFAYVLKRK